MQIVQNYIETLKTNQKDASGRNIMGYKNTLTSDSKQKQQNNGATNAHSYISRDPHSPL